MSCNLNIGYTGLLGILFLITYFYFSNFLLPHGLYHNSILNLLVIFFFLYYFSNKKNELLFLIIFVVLIISFFIFKTHDDFPYYHFPYTYHITQNSTVFGIGDLKWV